MAASSSVSDFSIERILSPQMGLKHQPLHPHPHHHQHHHHHHHHPRLLDFTADTFLHSIGLRLDHVNFLPAPPAAPPVPVVRMPGWKCVDEAFFACGAGFGSDRMFPNSGVHGRFSSHEPTDAQPLPVFPGFHHLSAAVMAAQPRQKSRMRTVFTDGQCKHLEALFELTDYPTVKARAEVASNTGLSEETVRVWFKNRRARRRKTQRSGSNVKSPSP